MMASSDRTSNKAGSRRRLKPDERRRELLATAIRVLRERGPDDCRVEDITAAARTSKGNFYRYFATWGDLLLAVRDQLLEDYGEEVRLRYADRSDVDWWAALEEETDRFLTFQLGLGGLHEVAFHGPASRLRPIDEDHSAASLIAALLAAGISAGAFADIDVEATAVLLFCLWHGAADEIAAGMDRQRAQRAAITITHRALEPQTTTEMGRPKQSLQGEDS
jgi:AcrR family transcriptional regulator